jgi:queuine tRNA-ribosyltransferase
MFRTLDVTVPHLPQDRPRYLMGVGKPLDIVGAVLRGIDMFDCVLPTRSGRTAQAFTSFGPLNLRNAKHANDPRPLDPSVPCDASRLYSRAYLHHLVRCEELLGLMLLSWHNVAFYQKVMAGLRAAIMEGRLAAYAAQFAADQARDEDAGA